MPSTTEMGETSPNRTSDSSPSSASPSPSRETSNGNNAASTNGSHSQTSGSVSKVDPLYIQRARVTRLAAPKPAQNPMQFVQVKPCGLFKSAQDQLKQAEELRKAKEAEEKEIRRRSELSEPEDWQNNLDSWKSSRRKRVEHIIDRVVEVKKLELEDFDRNRRKSKTFSEMMEERGSRRKVSLPPMYSAIEDDTNDLSDLGIGSASGKSSLESDCDSQNDEIVEMISSKCSQQHLAQSSCGSSSLGEEREDDDFQASDGEEYTYESAIQGYKSRISKSKEMSQKPMVVDAEANTKKNEQSDAFEKKPPTIYMSLRDEKSVVVECVKEWPKNNCENRVDELIENDNNESKYDVPKISDFKLRKLVFEKGIELDQIRETEGLNLPTDEIESNGIRESVDLKNTDTPLEIEIRPLNDEFSNQDNKKTSEISLIIKAPEFAHDNNSCVELNVDEANFTYNDGIIEEVTIDLSNKSFLNNSLQEITDVLKDKNEESSNNTLNEESVGMHQAIMPAEDEQEAPINETTTVIQALEIALDEIDKQHKLPMVTTSTPYITEHILKTEPIYENIIQNPIQSAAYQHTNISSNHHKLMAHKPMAIPHQSPPIILPFNLLASPTNMEPPSEKPPPPPVDDDVENVDTPEEPSTTFRRQNSTQRIKNDLRNKRFSFLGLEPVEIDFDDVVKEPQISSVYATTIEQQHLQLQNSPLKKPTLQRVSMEIDVNCGKSLEEQIMEQEQVLQVERELLHLEQEELRRQRLNLFSRKDELMRNKSQMRFDENKRRSMPNLQSEFKLNYFFNPIELNESSERQLSMSKSTEEFFPNNRPVNSHPHNTARRYSEFQPQDIDVTEKRRKNPLNYQNHWLIQEAEQCRIDQQRGVQRQSLNNNNNNIHKYSGSSYPQTTTAAKDVDSKPLPDAIIKTLTQRVQSRMVGERRLSRDADMLPFQHNINNNTIMHQSPPPPPIAKRPPLHDAISNVLMDDHREMLSVSGKKKCSSCGEELGHGAAMIIESLRLFYHLECFRCCVCFNKLGDGFSGADVRIRSQKKLHCHNCFSSDDGVKFSCV